MLKNDTELRFCVISFPMRVEIINTGSELLLGSTLNTHGAWLGQQLMPLGLRVQRLVTVPDGDPIRAAIKESVEGCDALIVTGGLGPTSDDVTREATAEALGVDLIEDEHAVRCIEQFFEKLGRPMTPSNLKQAQHPVGADVLPNPHGTAPGVYVPPRMGSASPCAIFLLPGPPHEMHAMFESEVYPRLKALVEIPEDHGITEVKFSGVGESSFQDALDEKLNAIDGGAMEVGYCARPGEMDLRLIGTSAQRLEGKQLAISTYPDFYVNEDGASLEATLVRELAASGKKLALAESCTGGRISSRITDVSGASAVFTHGYVTYANEAKVAMLDVNSELIESHGAVSEEVAKAMAEGALLKSGADISISVTGIAGPTGGTDDKPVGTVWIGIAEKSASGIEVSAEPKLYPQGREVFKQQVSQATLMKILRVIR